MILCCGEALIDMLPRSTAEGEDAFAPYPGGAVFNTAIALGRLGAPSGFLCGLGQDLFGEILRDALAASNVDASPSPRYDKPTTLAFVKLVDGQATYAFYDENTALRALTADDLPDTQAEALFFGGISLVSDCGAAYESYALANSDKTIMMDPNIRPGFIRDGAAYRARLDAMLGVTDIVKISDEDLEWLQGNTDPAPLLAHGAQVVLLTKGAEGVTVVRPSGQFDVPAQRAEVVDTVGAGDTFNAGFLAGLHRANALGKAGLAGLSDDVLREAAALGAAAAAVTVARAGANPPWASEL